MLTNLDWIAPGKPYPPQAEVERIRRYQRNGLLFEGRHYEVFGGEFRRVEQMLNKRRMEPTVVFNYPQLLTRKTADFVCGEPVTLEVGGEALPDELGEALLDMNFNAILYEAMMDVSRFGDAPIKVLSDRISGVAPEFWFPIVDATDLKRVDKHVIAFPTDADEFGIFHKIYVEIHERGTVETRVYAANMAAGALCFGALLEEPKCLRTGVEGFAVKVLRNVSHSKQVFGMDDYGPIAGLAAKLMWRLHCIDQVLDKHSEPSLSGPEGALSYDGETGMYYLDLGNYFKRSSGDDPDVKYLTWDGDLDSSFKEMEFLIEQIYVLSEMGAAFTDGQEGGQALSGTAMKLRLVSPRIKAQRIAGINTGVVKQLIETLAAVRGIELDGAVSVSWNDGLPNDPREDVEVLLAANGGLPVESHVSTVRRWNGVNELEARGIAAEIGGEDKPVV